MSDLIVAIWLLVVPIAFVAAVLGIAAFVVRNRP